MQRSRCLLRSVSLIALAAGVIAATPQTSSGVSLDPAKHWNADNGNDTCSNLLFSEEFEDLDVIHIGDTELFQWVNLMHGNTMLMSRTDHQYMATKPNSPDSVTANALGATAARKSGAESKWEAVE